MASVGRAITLSAWGLSLSALGFAVAASPASDIARHIVDPPSNEDTNRLFVPGSDAARAVEDRISNSNLAQDSRRTQGFQESRPHLKFHPLHRQNILTAGPLMGEGRTTVPPVAWSRADGESFISIWHTGDDVCGHPGIVHGGYLATMLDEGLARCCISALPHKVAMTAELKIDYISPVPAGSFLVLRAETTRTEGRKAWVEGRLETLDFNGSEPTVHARATALFISPKQANVSLRSWFLPLE